MVLHYCDIFGDCYHCPAAYCPYEKLDEKRWDDEDEEDEEDDG